MWSWFGGAAAQKRKDAPKEAILLLREQLDMLQKREKHLENQIGEQDAAARKHVNTNKNGTVSSLPSFYPNCGGYILGPPDRELCCI